MNQKNKLIINTELSIPGGGLLGFDARNETFIDSIKKLFKLHKVDFFEKIKNIKPKVIDLIINGFKIGIIGLICYSGYVIMFKQLEEFNIYSISVCILTFLILDRTKIHPIFLVVISGLIGYFFEL